MGEAKLRTAVKASVLRTTELLRAHSSPDGFVGLQLLAIDLGCQDAAMTYLGEFPAALQEGLSIARKQQTACSSSTTAPTTVLWFGWPCGRQQVTFLRTTPETVRCALIMALSGAAARGYGACLTSFAEPIWRSTFASLEPGFNDLSAAVSSEVARVYPSISIVGLGAEAQLITLPKMLTEEDEFGALGSVLRILDEFATTSDSLLRHCGRVSLSFDGLDDDPREVWDIPSCAQLMQEVDRHAPHWLWLASPVQYVMWLATLVADGKTQINEMSQVVLALDNAGAETVLQRGIHAAVDVLKFAGQDPMLDGVEAKLRRVQATLHSAVELMCGRIVGGGHGKVTALGRNKETSSGQ